MILFASDLDNTLIYSYKKKPKNSICVEWKEGKELSFMSRRAYDLLAEAAGKVCFVPITTRSIEQYQRISFGNETKITWALAANGGLLLKNGEMDARWRQETFHRMEDSRESLLQALALLKHDTNIIFDIRLVDGIFVYTKSVQPEKTLAVLRKKLDGRQVFLDANGEKIYVFPKCLTKGFALERLKQKLLPKKVIAAGDSGFDLSMAEIADVFYGPQALFLESAESHVCLYQGEKTGFADFLLEDLLNHC